MVRRNTFNFLAMAVCVGVWSGQASRTLAADFESFEFNDANATQLADAVNTANPGNAWVVSSGMAPSQVQNSLGGRPSSYYIVKSSSALESNYLDIANITSGTRYLTTRISGWDFEGEVSNEQFRLAFMNDDDPPDFGNTITAQMQLGRVASGDVVLTGSALGGGSNIVNTATFPAILSNAFEMTLELNKDANTYKVFYKNGVEPTQVLGAGTVAPTRGGNSLRMVANNNFGDFFINFSSEDNFIDFFAVDRIAVADTNPHTDLITLEVDRDDGAMTLRNTSGTMISGIESYSITSAAGGLDPAGWMPIAGGANSSSNEELMQSFGGGGISLANGEDVSLSMGTGAWIKSPYEDVEMVLNLTGGATRTVDVSFIDNGGQRYMPGDFNFMGGITVADYQILIDNAETDLSTLSIAQAYQKGDLDRNRVNSIRDFVEFKELYLAANPGAGSFSAIFGVPEPSTLLSASFAALLLAFRRSRRPSQRWPMTQRRFQRQILHHETGGTTIRRACMLLLNTMLVASAFFAGGSIAFAVVLEDFTFDEPNGSTLGDAENSANMGNGWLVHSRTVESAIVDGNFRIQKQSEALQATNALEIDNIISGKAWLVAEIAGWFYTATPSATSERVRFSFMDNDPASTGGSTVTAEANIDRSGAGLELNGSALSAAGGATPIDATYALPLIQTDPFTIVLELDKTADQYSVYYKDGGNPFTFLGTGELGESPNNAGDRDGNSIRFAFTGEFGDVGEFFDVDRIYLTDTNPVVGVVNPSALSLVVNTTSGDVSIVNSTDDPISFDSYRITSGSDSLSFSDWESLSDRMPPLDPINGGDDPGETWDETGGSGDSVLAESFLLSSSMLGPDAFLSLGQAFKMGGMQDLAFQYHDVDTGAIVNVDPTYIVSAAVLGDYNENGVVDAADYTVWRDRLNQMTTLPNTDPLDIDNMVTTAEYNFWVSRFGMTSGAGSLSTAAAVPEPATALMGIAALSLAAALMRCRAGARQRMNSQRRAWDANPHPRKGHLISSQVTPFLNGLATARL